MWFRSYEVRGRHPKSTDFSLGRWPRDYQNCTGSYLGPALPNKVLLWPKKEFSVMRGLWEHRKCFEDISCYSDFLIYGNFLKIDRDFNTCLLLIILLNLTLIAHLFSQYMIESDKQLLLSASKGLVAMIWPFTVTDLCLSAVYRRIGLKAITLIGWGILCYIGWVEIIRVCVLTRWVLGPWFCVRRRLWSFWGSWSSAGCFFVFFLRP